MNTSELNKPITAAQLNESMFKKFGQRINFDKYTREDLENYRNLLRTQIHQAETASNFNDLLTNETYQKNKYVMTVINTKIKEMLGESVLNEKAVSQQQQKFMGMVHAVQKGEMKAPSKEVAKAAKGMSKKAAHDYAATKHKGLPKKKKADEGVEENTMNRATLEAKKAKKDYDGDGKIESPKDEVWGSRAKAAAKAGKPFKESAKPDFLDLDKDGNKKEPMKKAAKDKKVKETAEKTSERDIEMKKQGGGTVKVKATQYKGHQSKAADKQSEKEKGLDEAKACCCEEKGKKKCPVHGKKMDEARAIFRNHVAIVNESLRTLIQEDEEGKAKAITAASDMVNDFTTWMQRVGQYQTKSMIELADAIRAEFGPQEAETFKQAVAPALANTIETLTQQREAISHAVAVLAGEATEVEPMGGEPGMEAPVGGEEMPPEDDFGDDEFGASDAAAGGAETSGREIREGHRARKLAESHSLMRILSK